MEMRCYRKILCISCKDHFTNEEVCANIQQAVGPHGELLTIWICLLFITSGQKPVARHNERGKKTRQTEKAAGRQHQGMDRPGVRQVPERSREQTGENRRNRL